MTNDGSIVCGLTFLLCVNHGHVTMTSDHSGRMCWTVRVDQKFVRSENARLQTRTPGIVYEANID